MSDRPERPKEKPIVHIKDVKVGLGAAGWLQLAGAILLGVSALLLLLHLGRSDFMSWLMSREMSVVLIPLLIFGLAAGFAVMLSPWVVQWSGAGPERSENRTLVRGFIVGISCVLLFLLSCVLFVLGLGSG